MFLHLLAGGRQHGAQYLLAVALGQHGGVFHAEVPAIGFRLVALVEHGAGDHDPLVLGDQRDAGAVQQVAQMQRAGLHRHPGAAMLPALVDAQRLALDVLHTAMLVQALPDGNLRAVQL